jgi:hypothetical protein
MKLSKSVSAVVDSIQTRDCQNLTQKVLLTFLRSDKEFITRSSMRIPNVGSRVRDLRKPEFGGFTVQCVRGERNPKGGYSTSYRLDPQSVTLDRVKMAFASAIEARQTA